MKEIVVILTHADTIDKIECLKLCVQTIKNLGYDTVISSHIKIPDEILEMTDLLAYDKENSFISNDECFINIEWKFWFKHALYEEEYIVKNFHCYGVWRLILSGVGLAYAHGYDKAHIVNYDYIIKDPGIIKRHSQKLDYFDIFGYDTFGDKTFDCFISFRIEKFIKYSRHIDSKQKYLEKNYPVPTENFLFVHLVDNCGFSFETDKIKVLEDNDNVIINSKKFSPHVVNDNFSVLLVREKSKDNYFISLRCNINRSARVFITISGVKRYYDIIPNDCINLIEVTDPIIKNLNIKIEIPELKYSIVYNIKSGMGTGIFLSETRDFVIHFDSLNLSNIDHMDVTNKKNAGENILIMSPNLDIEGKLSKLIDSIKEIRGEKLDIVLADNIIIL